MGKKQKKSTPPPRIRGTYHLTQVGVEADEIRSLILRRRLQVLVHSCIYYVFNENIVSDSTWSEWARELAQLQKDYPKIADRVDYAKEFKGFDASTGYHLPTRNIEIMNKAQDLLRLYKEDKYKYGYPGHNDHRAKSGSDVIRLTLP